MALELHQVFPNGTVVRTGSIRVSMPAGRKVEFKTFAGGEVNKFFEGEVPVGKTWELSVSVSVKET